MYLIFDHCITLEEGRVCGMPINKPCKPSQFSFSVTEEESLLVTFFHQECCNTHYITVTIWNQITHFRDSNVWGENLFCWNLCQICTVGSKGFECTEKSNKLLIKGGTVVNADHQQQADVYVEDGIITLVAPNLKVPKNSPLKFLSVKILLTKYLSCSIGVTTQC